MTDPTALEEGDELDIDHEGVSGRTFEVMDVDVEGIGLTKVFGVTLLSGSDRYVLEGTSTSDTVMFLDLESDEAEEVEKGNISVE